MAVQLLSRTVEHEFTLDLCPRPGWVRVVLAAFCLGLPPLAATGESAKTSDKLASFDYYSVPSGSGQRLTVTGMTALGRSAPTGGSAAVVLVTTPPAANAPCSNLNSCVGIGLPSGSSPNRLLHVDGNTRTGGCFWIGSTSRCTWYQ